MKRELIQFGMISIILLLTSCKKIQEDSRLTDSPKTDTWYPPESSDREDCNGMACLRVSKKFDWSFAKEMRLSLSFITEEKITSARPVLVYGITKSNEEILLLKASVTSTRKISAKLKLDPSIKNLKVLTNSHEVLIHKIEWDQMDFNNNVKTMEIKIII